MSDRTPSRSRRLFLGQFLSGLGPIIFPSQSVPFASRRILEIDTSPPPPLLLLTLFAVHLSSRNPPRALVVLFLELVPPRRFDKFYAYPPATATIDLFASGLTASNTAICNLNLDLFGSWILSKLSTKSRTSHFQSFKILPAVPRSVTLNRNVEHRTASIQ